MKEADKDKKEVKCVSCDAVGKDVGGSAGISWLKYASEKLNEEYEMCICDKCSIGHALLGLGVALKKYTVHDDLKATGSCLIEAAMAYASEVQEQDSNKDSLQDASSSTNAIISDQEAIQTVALINERGGLDKEFLDKVRKHFELYKENLRRTFHIGFKFMYEGKSLEVRSYTDKNTACAVLPDTGIRRYFTAGEMINIWQTLLDE